MSTAVRSPNEALERIKAGFELVEQPHGRALIEFPITWASGDYLPIFIERTEEGWRLTDDSWHYEEFSVRTLTNFYRGKTGEAVGNVLAAHSLQLEEGKIVRTVAIDEDWAYAYAQFVRGLLALERVIDRIPARRLRPRRSGQSAGGSAE
jgi:hypothetical protein